MEWRWCLDHGSADGVWWRMKCVWMWFGRVGAGSPAWKQAEAKGGDVTSFLLALPQNNAFCNLSLPSKPSCCPWCSGPEGDVHSPSLLFLCSSNARKATSGLPELSCSRGTQVPLLHELSSLLQSSRTLQSQSGLSCVSCLASLAPSWLQLHGRAGTRCRLGARPAALPANAWHRRGGQQGLRPASRDKQERRAQKKKSSWDFGEPCAGRLGCWVMLSLPPRRPVVLLEPGRLRAQLSLGAS